MKNTSLFRIQQSFLNTNNLFANKGWKAFLMLCIVFLLNTTPIKAQSFELGALAGLNFSNVVGADVTGNGIRLGFHLGGYAYFEIDEKWGLRPELLLYSQKGTSSGDFHSSYIEIPLMATYSFDDKFKAMAGIQPSFLYTAAVGDGRGDISNLIRSLDFGIILGAWYQIDDKWGLGARFVPGVARVGADGSEQTYNFNFQLSAGYRFM